MKEEIRIRIRRLTAYLSLATVLSYIITGYGITNYSIVEKLTFGVLYKSLSFKIHMWLIIPLALCLSVHLYFSCNLFRKEKKDKPRGEERS